MPTSVRIIPTYKQQVFEVKTSWSLETGAHFLNTVLQNLDTQNVDRVCISDTPYICVYISTYTYIHAHIKNKNKLWALSSKFIKNTSNLTLATKRFNKCFI